MLSPWQETPIPLALVLYAALGTAFALCARDRLRADGPFAAPAFPLVLSFSGLIVLPTTLYLLVAYPAWAWLYLVDPGRVPGLSLFPLLVLHAVMPIAAWYVAARLLRAQRDRAILYTLGGCAALWLILFLLLRDRVLAVGSYRDYGRGLTAGLMEVKLGYSLLALLGGCAAATVFVALELLRDARRVRAR